MLDYIILGIIQGIFEWLPISSEGIVALVSQFLLKNVNSVDIALFLHLGTVFAVFVYFWKDWKDVFLFKNKATIRFLSIATVVSLTVGYPLYNLVNTIVLGNALLLLMGFGLLATAFFYKTKKEIKIGNDKLALVSGFLQGLAVIPGLSRSGATIFGLSLAKKDFTDILKTSYMMSVPVVLASSLFVFMKEPVFLAAVLPGLVFSFLVGILSLHFLLEFSKKIDFFKFALVFSLLCFIGAIIDFAL